MTAWLSPLIRVSAARSAKQQNGSALRDPALWRAAINDAGNLSFDGVDLPRLVAEHGSPLLAVSRSKLQADAGSVLSAVSAAFAGAMVAFSYKTNGIPGVLRELHDAGFAAEVISPYELWLAERLGVPGDRIIVNGVNKDYEFLHSAVRAGAASINIDHPGELEHLAVAAAALRRRPRLCLRLKVDRSSHFGLAIESGEAESVARKIAGSPELFDFAGLHFHAVADNDDPATHVRYMNTALEFALHIRNTLGLTVGSLNIGGGYTVPTMKVMSRFEYARQRLLGVPACPPDPSDGTPFTAYVSQVAHALRSWCNAHDFAQPRIVLEPGRVVTSQSHVMLTRVHAIKPNLSGPPDFAMTDAGKILTSYPCDYEYHQMFAANRMREAATTSYHLMGRLCTSADWLAKHRSLPALRAGDVVAIMDAGAYFTSYASNFAYPRPAVVMLDNGRSHILRGRETPGHMTAMDRIDAPAASVRA